MTAFHQEQTFVGTHRTSVRPRNGLSELSVRGVKLPASEHSHNLPASCQQEAQMSVEGLILHHGEAHGVTLHQTRVDYLVTAEHSKHCSLFEFTVAPGFNTGAHYHTKIEEIFYVLEGELDLRCGERTVRGG